LVTSQHHKKMVGKYFKKLWSQSFDFWIYNYNARLARFLQSGRNYFFFFSKRTKLLVALRIFTALALQLTIVGLAPEIC
jgi:hypothetical protein